MEARAALERALAALLGAAAALVLAEIAVRVADPYPKPLPSLAIADYRLSADPILRYEFRPGIKAGGEHFDPHHAGFATNAAGFRDREFSVEKAPGSTRVVVLGDSIAAGNGVPEVAQVFSRKLEDALNLGRPKARWEVLNMGVGGYHTLQEAQTLKLKGLAYKPDVVVVVFAMNDFDARSDGGVEARLASASPEGQRPFLRSVAESSSGWMTRRSRLLFFLRHRLAAARMAPSALEGTNPVAAGLSLLARLQKSARFRLFVVISPAFDRPFDRYAHMGIHEALGREAAPYPGITVIDPLGDFRRLGVPPKDLSVDFLHPNGRGHDALAQAVAKRLLSTGRPKDGR